MSVYVAFDIYPAATPNGTLLVRLVAGGAGTPQAVELTAKKVLHGTGEGTIRIHSAHPDATTTNFAKRNYVKVVVVNGATETEWFGFFLEQGDFGAISRREQGGRMLTFTGLGPLFYLDRAVLLAEIYAPGQPRRGNLTIDGSWGWNDIPYGAIMTRAMEEGFYAPGSPLSEATWDFTRTEDSAAVAWPNIDNEFIVPWGTSVYELIASFIRLGLVVTVDPDLTFHAWQTYGTNRTSATFAAGKIRYEHGVNITNEVVRQIRASLERSHIFVTGDEFTSTVVSGGSSAVTYYDNLDKRETNDPATLTAAGERDLAQREIQADAAFPVRVIIDDDELNGLYVPGEHYDVGDIVTIDTVPPDGASGTHDYVNFAIEVAAIKLEHDEAGNWFAVNELGAQYLTAQLSAFEVASGKVVHQIELCRPIAGSLSTFVDGNVAFNNSTFITIPSGLTDSALFVCVSQRNDGANITGVTYDPDPGDPGTTYALTKVPGSEVTGPDLSGHEWWYLLSPVASVDPAGGSITADSGTAPNPGVFLLEGVDQTTPFSGFVSNSGTSASSSLTISVSASQLPIDSVHTWTNNSNPGTTPPTPSGALAWADSSDQSNPGSGDQEVGGSYGDATPVWTFSGVNVTPNWVASGMAINGGATTPGDGHPDLIGTSIRAKRCDDTEHYHTTANPTVNDDTTLGFRNNTLWINESTGAMFLLLDNSAGAADWLAVGGGADLSGIDFLVGTASGLLSGEIVAGTTPGGELGGTWGSPTVDSTHAGSNHLQPVRKNSTGTVFERRRLNLIEGTNVTLTVADDAGNDEVDITIASTGSGSGIAVEEDGTEEGTGIDRLDFTTGLNVSVAGSQATISADGGGTGNVVAEPTGSTITIPGLAIADREPSSPDASDDEFDTADTDPIAGWTTLGTPDIMDTNTTSPSHLYIKQNATAGVNFEGLYKAKSPAFTVRAKLSGTTHRDSFQTACLFIGEATPGKIEFISLRNQSIAYVPTVGVYAFTTPTGSGSIVNNTGIQMHAPVYFKIVVASSTDVSYYYGRGAMPDGGPWTPITLARNPGFTVGSVGLAVEAENGTHAVEGLFDWIRFG